jgi:hypothetical protein
MFNTTTKIYHWAISSVTQSQFNICFNNISKPVLIAVDLLQRTSIPGIPGIPRSPFTPLVFTPPSPASPGIPGGPSPPGGPLTPGIPGGPCSPAWPSVPLQPSSPGGPGGPSSPVVPCQGVCNISTLCISDQHTAGSLTYVCGPRVYKHKTFAPPHQNEVQIW